MAGNIFTVLSGRLHREERMIQTQTNVDRNVAEGKRGVNYMRLLGLTFSTSIQAGISLLSFSAIRTTVVFRPGRCLSRYDRICSDLLVELEKVLFVSLLVLFAASPRASSQTLKEDHLTAKVAPQRAAKPESIKGSLTSGATPNGAPGLCFQPGIGWQRVPMGKPNGSDTPGCGSSGNVESTESASGESSESVYAQHSGGKQGIAPGIEMESAITGDRGQATASGGSTSINSGKLVSLPGNLPFNPGSASGRLTAMSSMYSGGKYLTSGPEPEISANQVKDLKSHAYVSSIGLRRMIRNTSDLQTRIRLQELQSELSHKSYVSTVSSSGNQYSKGRSKTLHVSKAYSSSVPDGHGHAPGIAREPY